MSLSLSLVDGSDDSGRDADAHCCFLLMSGMQRCPCVLSHDGKAPP